MRPLHRSKLAASLVVSSLLGAVAANGAAQTRALGIDVSDWQNQTTTGLPIDWARVARPVAQGGGGKQFAFIRSSRGGTTGTYDEHTTVGTSPSNRSAAKTTLPTRWICARSWAVAGGCRP